MSDREYTPPTPEQLVEQAKYLESEAIRLRRQALEAELEPKDQALPAGVSFIKALIDAVEKEQPCFIRPEHWGGENSRGLWFLGDRPAIGNYFRGHNNRSQDWELGQSLMCDIKISPQSILYCSWVVNNLEEV